LHSPSTPDIITKFFCAETVPGIELAVCLKVAFKESACNACGKFTHGWILRQNAKKEGLEEAII
jgi:hypothetical protein